LRNRGTEHVHESSMKWMSSVQNDNATEPWQHPFQRTE
jgi:hypothetical protein